MKLKLGKLGIVLVALAVLALVVSILALIAHITSKNSVEAYKAQLRAAGEKLTIAELIPPRVPDESNSAAIFRQVMGILQKTPQDVLTTNPPEPMAMIESGKAIVGWKQPEIYGRDLGNDPATNTWDEVEGAIEQQNVTVDLLHQIVQRPVLDFGLNYQQGYRLPLPHLGHLKRSIQLLTTAMECDLHRADAASAFTNLHDALVFVEALTNEPVAISGLVRVAIAGISFFATWEFLQSTNATEDQLAVLQNDWAQAEFVRPMEAAIKMERAMVQVSLAQLRSSNNPASSLGGRGRSGGSGSGSWYDQLVELPGNVWRGTKLKTAETIWQASWSYSDELRILQGEQVLIDAIHQVETNRCFNDVQSDTDRKLNALGLKQPASNQEWLWGDEEMNLRDLPGQVVGSLASVVGRLARIEVARQIVITTIALKRYQLAHKNFPPDLSALVPQFLPKVPLDPMDGQPLRYRLNPDGIFLLYSVGKDGIDDGGDPTADAPSYFWQNGRDAVWPQPATDAEIQDYKQKKVPFDQN